MNEPGINAVSEAAFTVAKPGTSATSGTAGVPSSPARGHVLEDAEYVGLPEAGGGRCPPEAGAAPPAGVLSSNTPPLTRHFVGSEDWLDWMLYIDWLPAKWGELRDKLEKLKQLAQLGAPEGFRRWTVAGMDVCVDPAGAHLGDRIKGPYLAYRLEFEGMSAKIADRMTPHGDTPNAVIQIGGQACLLHGPEVCLNRCRSFVAELGGEIRRDKLSRVDMCLDMPGVRVKEFIPAFLEGRYVCRAKAMGFDKSNGVTLKVGKRPLLLRIYDKLAEALQGGKTLQLFALQNRRWGGGVPKSATRVEFELGRQALKDRGVDSLADYYAKRADLVRYLTHDWIRFTGTVVDRRNRNQGRAETLAVWHDVQAGFQEWAGSPSGLPLEPLNLAGVDVRQLAKQALGALKTAARLQGKPDLSREDLLAYAERTLRAVAQ